MIGAAACERLIYVDHVLGMGARAVYAVNHAQIPLARCVVHPGLVTGLRQAVALAEDPATRAANAAKFRMPRDWPTILAPMLDRIAQRHLKERFIVHR